MSSKADRYNEGKERMDLVPFYAIRDIARVYNYGSEKYDDHNWRKGLDWNEGCAASLLRHLSKWQEGEDYDEESGLPHDLHIAWNAITLVAMRLKEEGTDDRYKKETKVYDWYNFDDPWETDNSDYVMNPPLILMGDGTFKSIKYVLK